MQLRHRGFAVRRLLLTVGFAILPAVVSPAAEPAEPPRHARVRVSWSYSLTARFPFLNCQWNGIVSASDGKTYFAVSTNVKGRHAQLFRFDPAAQMISHLADAGKICGENNSGKTAQGVIHTQILEHRGRLYFGTMANEYTRDAEDNYPGGHFVEYDLETGRFRDIGPALRGKSLLSLCADPVLRRLYAMTWRMSPDGSDGSNHLVMADLKTCEIADLGPFEPRGPATRFLWTDKKGRVYGAIRGGRIWRFDPHTQRREILDAQLPAPGRGRCADRNPRKLANLTVVRTGVWDEATQGWYVVVLANEMLCRFDPARGTLKALGDFGLADYYPRRASLALCRAGRRLFYTPQSGRVNELMSYHIDRGAFRRHGPIQAGASGVFSIHSLVAGGDGKLHALGRVRGASPDAGRKKGTRRPKPEMCFLVIAVPKAPGPVLREGK